MQQPKGSILRMQCGEDGGTAPSIEWQSLTLLLKERQEGQRLLAELQEVTKVLRGRKTAEQSWQKRTKALDRIRSLFVDLVNHIDSDEGMLEVAKDKFKRVLRDADSKEKCQEDIQYALVSWIQRIIQPLLITQLQDSRISVVRETCGLITWMASEFQEEFSTQSAQNDSILGGGNGILYFKTEALPSLLVSSNKLLADLGHQTLRLILENSPPINNVEYYLIPFINQKTVILRLKAAQYFEILLQKGVKSQKMQSVNIKKRTESIQAAQKIMKQIKDNSDIFEYFLIKSIVDGDHDVRNQARYCFLLYMELMPCRSSALLLYGVNSAPIQKSILKELDLDMSQIRQDYESDYLSHENEQGVSLHDQVIQLKKIYGRATTPEEFMKLQKLKLNPRQSRLDLLNQVSDQSLIAIDQDVFRNNHSMLSKSPKIYSNMSKFQQQSRRSFGGRKSAERCFGGRKSAERSVQKSQQNKTQDIKPQSESVHSGENAGQKQNKIDNISSPNRTRQHSLYSQKSISVQSKPNSQARSHLKDYSPSRLQTIMKQYSLNQHDGIKQSVFSPTGNSSPSHRFTMQADAKLNQSMVVSDFQKSYTSNIVREPSEYKNMTTRSIQKQSSYLEQVPEEARFSKLFDQYKKTLSPSRKRSLDKCDEQKKNQTVILSLIKDRPKSGHPTHNLNKTQQLNKIQEVKEQLYSSGGSNHVHSSGIIPYQKLTRKNSNQGQIQQKSQHSRMNSDRSLEKLTKTVDTVFQENISSMDRKDKDHFRSIFQSTIQIDPSFQRNVLSVARESSIQTPVRTQTEPAQENNNSVLSSQRSVNKLETEPDLPVTAETELFMKQPNQMQEEVSNLYYQQTRAKSQQRQKETFRKKSVDGSKQLLTEQCKWESDKQSQFLEQESKQDSTIMFDAQIHPSRGQILSSSRQMATSRQGFREKSKTKFSQYQHFNRSILNSSKFNEINKHNFKLSLSQKKEKVNESQWQPDATSVIKERRRTTNRKQNVAVDKTVDLSQSKYSVSVLERQRKNSYRKKAGVPTLVQGGTDKPQGQLKKSVIEYKRNTEIRQTQHILRQSLNSSVLQNAKKSSTSKKSRVALQNFNNNENQQQKNEQVVMNNQSSTKRDSTPKQIQKQSILQYRKKATFRSRKPSISNNKEVNLTQINATQDCTTPVVSALNQSSQKNQRISKMSRKESHQQTLAVQSPTTLKQDSIQQKAKDKFQRLQKLDQTRKSISFAKDVLPNGGQFDQAKNALPNGGDLDQSGEEMAPPKPIQILPKPIDSPIRQEIKEMIIINDYENASASSPPQQIEKSPQVSEQSPKLKIKKNFSQAISPQKINQQKKRIKIGKGQINEQNVIQESLISSSMSRSRKSLRTKVKKESLLLNEGGKLQLQNDNPSNDQSDQNIILETNSNCRLEESFSAECPLTSQQIKEENALQNGSTLNPLLEIEQIIIDNGGILVSQQHMTHKESALKKKIEELKKEQQLLMMHQPQDSSSNSPVTQFSIKPKPTELLDDEPPATIRSELLDDCINTEEKQYQTLKRGQSPLNMMLNEMQMQQSPENDNLHLSGYSTIIKLDEQQSSTHQPIGDQTLLWSFLAQSENQSNKIKQENQNLMR